jgi:hypothetical protein
VGHVRLKYTEDKIEHLNAKLKRERDRRLRETKELLDEQVTFQNRHEAEMYRFKQSPLDHDRPPRYRQSITGQYDTGRPPLPRTDP